MSIQDSGVPAGTPPHRPPAAQAPAEAPDSAPGDGRFDAFISYRRLPLDTAFVDQLERDLADRGLRVWVNRGRLGLGSGLSPDGSFLYTGASGLAPTPPGGSVTVYQVAGAAAMTGLPAFLASGTASYSEFPAQPWSPDGTLLLAGNGVYRCDACQALPGLQATAASRIAWATPLSAGSDRPPATNPYS